MRWGGECVRVGFGVVFENRSFFMLGFVGTFFCYYWDPHVPRRPLKERIGKR